MFTRTILKKKNIVANSSFVAIVVFITFNFVNPKKKIFNRKWVFTF